MKTPRTCPRSFGESVSRIRGQSEVWFDVEAGELIVDGCGKDNMSKKTRGKPRDGPVVNTEPDVARDEDDCNIVISEDLSLLENRTRSALSDVRGRFVGGITWSVCAVVVGNQTWWKRAREANVTPVMKPRVRAVTDSITVTRPSVTVSASSTSDRLPPSRPYPHAVLTE